MYTPGGATFKAPTATPILNAASEPLQTNPRSNDHIIQWVVSPHSSWLEGACEYHDGLQRCGVEGTLDVVGCFYHSISPVGDENLTAHQLSTPLQLQPRHPAALRSLLNMLQNLLSVLVSDI